MKSAAGSAVAKAARTKLTLVEKAVVVQSFEAFCDLGHPLISSNIAHAIQCFVKNLPHKRQEKIELKHSWSSKKFVSLFLSRCTKKLKLGRPSKEKRICI